MSVASKPQAPSGVKQNPTIPRVLFDSANSSSSRIRYSGQRFSVPLKPSTTLRRTNKTVVPDVSVVSGARPVVSQSQRKLMNVSPSLNKSSNNLDSSDVSSSSIATRFETKPGFVSRIPVRKTSVLSSKQEKIPRKNVLQPKTNVASLAQKTESKVSLVSQSKNPSASRIPVLSSKHTDAKLSSKPSLASKQNTATPKYVGKQSNDRGLRTVNSNPTKNFILADSNSGSTQALQKKAEYQDKKLTPRKNSSSFTPNEDTSNHSKRLNLGHSRPAILSDSKLTVSLGTASRLKTSSDTKQQRSIPTALSRPEKTSSILTPLPPVKASSFLHSGPESKGLSQSSSQTALSSFTSFDDNVPTPHTNNISKSSTDDISFETYSSHTIEALKKVRQLMTTRGTPVSKVRAIKLTAIIAARTAPSSTTNLSNSPDSMDSFSNTFRYSPRAVPKELSQIPLPPTFYRTPSIPSIPSTTKASSAVTPKKPPSVSGIQTSSSESSVEKLRFPVSPHVALKTFGSKLSAHEKSEILNFGEIYYLGRDGKENEIETQFPRPFSSADGDLRFKTGDQLAYRYEIQKVLGKGSFGQVVQAYDHKHKREVAIKIIKSSEKFQRQALTEIGILEALARYDRERIYHVLHITGSFRFRKHLCIVTELYGCNLYEHIKANQFNGFKPSLVRSYAIQILKCLCLLQANDLIHCDLKPENILLTGANSDQIKVIDFGSSCYSDQRIYTYIQSRFYRSPEVVLELPYGPAIDMWSFGCIIVELITGYPIFPGESEPELMSRIVEVLGLPDPGYLSKSRRRVSYFDLNGNLRISHRYKKRAPGSKPLSLILNNSDELLIDFVSKCLQFSPENRMSPQEAINHPWITGSRSSTSSSFETESPLFAKNQSHSENPAFDYIQRHPDLFPQPILSYDYVNKSVVPNNDLNNTHRF